VAKESSDFAHALRHAPAASGPREAQRNTCSPAFPPRILRANVDEPAGVLARQRRGFSEEKENQREATSQFEFS
jgi:hypothetical protein